MFHKSVLGRFAGDIVCDEWGYVPQFGDQPYNFDWGRRRRFSHREWNNILWDCERKTRNALLKEKGKYRTRFKNKKFKKTGTYSGRHKSS